MTAPTRRALRFLTAGSVDDGKSTLIGRLLYDSRAILADQLSAIESRSAHATRIDGGPSLDLSLLTDGLEAEREQGITIDVAWRYFATPRRKFVMADAPGHERYTRNMVTAAAGSDAALVLVDITRLDLAARPLALLTQTRRHTLLARLLRVPSIVFVVNKIDAVADPGPAFTAVRDAVLAFAKEAEITVAGVVPVSALRGDNVTRRLVTPWNHGPSLLELLEGLPAGEDPAGSAGSRGFALPVQYVTRDSGAAEGGDLRRTLWGRIARGAIRNGDAIEVFPSGERATVAEILVAGRTVDTAQAGISAGIVLDRQLDVSRGDWLAAPAGLVPTRRFAAALAWLDTEPAVAGRKYQLRHGHRWVQARFAAIESRLDIQTLRREAADRLAVNEIGRVVVEAQEALPVEPFESSRVGGSLIVVDPASNRTSGALLVAAEAA
jgi:sulfate adenylyltransferase subunit 1